VRLQLQQLRSSKGFHYSLPIQPRVHMIVTEFYKTSEEIVGACLAASSLAPLDFPPDLPTTPLLSGAPGWYDFEEQTWPIGEAIERSLKSNPSLRLDTASTSAILSVVHCVNLRRGRQSFVMALGHKAVVLHAPTLAAYLNDQDICGHVLDALLKMQAPDFAEQVSVLLNHKQSWVRRLARRYMERYGVLPNNSFKPNPLRGSA
jgi:hypothetical protein